MTTTTNIEDSESARVVQHVVEQNPPTDPNNREIGKRSIQELLNLVKLEKFEPSSLYNEEIIDLMKSRGSSIHRLETYLGKKNAQRCVEIRRLYYTKQFQDCTDHDHLVDRTSFSSDDDITRSSKSRTYKPDPQIISGPMNSEFDYERIVGACCENVVGCVRIPVGLAGPLDLDGNVLVVPMATTEGCLVASTSRGLTALSRCGGVISRVTSNRMTRAPIVKFQDPHLKDAITNIDNAINWLTSPENKLKIQKAFRSSSKHTNLIDYTLERIGREIHIRFEAHTGDAMGMNMCTKGAEFALKEMQLVFPTMQILTLSGNMCTDKKPSAINMIRGRGKSVICSASLRPEVVKEVLKVDIDSLIEVWKSKVMIGSALAGSIGGSNCHAANIVSAIFLATGQDAAQVVSSSNCIFLLEKDIQGHLEVHCSMKSIECGTVGGGTQLNDQAGFLGLMGIRGSSPADISSDADSNACALARIICATVMAAELSLLASLTQGTLVKSHMTHNRSSQSCKLV